MPDRRKLLVHLRRLSGVLDRAFRNGPDGTHEGKHGNEHPLFVHYGCAFYLAGILGFLEGEDGSYSWNQPGANHQDFDVFAATDPPGRASFASRGITRATLTALAQLRNAVVHHDGDLSKNHNAQSLAMVQAANFPGVALKGSVATLTEPFLEYVRLVGLAVRRYYGDD
jgi:hypothetical protein